MPRDRPRAGGQRVRIVQISDIHVGSGLFRPELLEAAIEETNALGPDLVAIAGDLTMEGYRWEFEEARGYLDRLECENVVVVPGNHDAKNVGYRHFEDFFGLREGAVTVSISEGEAKVVALDSTKPDLDEGEIGREHYSWIDSEFRNWDRGPKIVVVHHHILAVPGTGRDVNNLRDAGDVMAIFRRSEEHTPELQSRQYLVCRLLLEKNRYSTHSGCSNGSSTNSSSAPWPAARRPSSVIASRRRTGSASRSRSGITTVRSSGRS